MQQVVPQSVYNKLEVRCRFWGHPDPWVRTVSVSTRRGLVAKGMIMVQESADVQ